MKRFKYLSILLITILVLTGCGKEKEKSTLQSPEEAKKTVETALSNLTQVKSAKMNIQLELGAGDAVLLNLTGTVETAGNDEAHVMMSMTTLGQSQQSETYLIKEENVVYEYVTVDNGATWNYTTVDLSDSNLTEENVDLQSISQILSVFKEVKEVDSDIEGTSKYVLILDASSIADFMNQNLEGSSNLVESPKEDTSINLYMKDNQVTRISIDLEDALTDNTNINFTNYSMVIDITDINQINDIVVPEDIKNRATFVESIDMNF